jgi:hypothetical protein
MQINQEKMATTAANKWFPSYVPTGRFEPSESRKNFYEQIAGNVYSYCRPKNVMKDIHSYHSISRPAEFLEQLTDENKLKIYRCDDYRLTVCRGYIADENDNILLLLATDSFENLIENSGVRRRRVINHSHLKLFLSSEIFTAEKYSELWEILKDRYIPYCYHNKVPVEITTSERIEKDCYNTGFNVDFNSVTELNEKFNGLHKLLGNNISELFGIFDTHGGTELEDIYRGRDCLAYPLSYRIIDDTEDAIEEPVFIISPSEMGYRELDSVSSTSSIYSTDEAPF